MRDPIRLDLEAPTYSVVGFAVILALLGAFFRFDPIPLAFGWAAFAAFAYGTAVAFTAWDALIAGIAGSRVSDNVVAGAVMWAVVAAMAGLLWLLG